MWRKRRIPHVCQRGAHVSQADCGGTGRGRGARRICVRGPFAAASSGRRDLSNEAGSQRRENTMRICSLLPSATEILYAIGLGDSILGVSHECDFPADATTKPSLLRLRVDTRETPAEIDRQVGEIIARGESIYAVDAELLSSLDPDLIVTQDLCHVCAASPDDLATALTRFPRRPQVLSLTPRSIEEVWDDIRRVGAATGHSREAEA